MENLLLRATAVTSVLTLILSGCQKSPTASSPSNTTVASSTIQTTKTSATDGLQSTLPKDSPIKSVVDWNQPSGGDYPKLTKGEPIWIDVSIGKQRVYIKDGDKTLYTMATSSGLDTSPDNSTPKGTFYIQPERGTWFYSKAEQEGAKYYVSWKNHGEFLFHSVAMDKDGNVIESEAEKLGEKASHGCFRLTIPDAKWIYDHIPVKTKVVIHE
jgi:hypothetical protein